LVKAFEQLELPFGAMELPSINGACEPNDIFVIFEKDDFNDIKESARVTSACAGATANAAML